MHHFSGALPLQYVPARVTRGSLVAHCHSFAPPCCKTSQYRRTFVPLSASLWNDFSDPVFDGVGMEGFNSREMLSCRPNLLFIFFLLLFFLFSSFHGLVVWGWVFGLIECSHSLPTLHC